jgi:hypothetical protein
MKQTECNCPTCTGREFFSGFSYREGRYVYEEEQVSEPPKSVWERLGAVIDELEALKVPARLINELNDICDTIDSIDSEIVKLAKKLDSIDLGEISKKLY